MSNRMNTATAERPTLVTSASLKQLLDLWDITDAQPITAELPIVRGWLMDELEARDPEAFNAWLDSDWTDNPEIATPRYWFKV